MSARVILGASSFADAGPVLGLALALAAEAGAELRGLLVEDDAHLALSGLSSACIVDAAGRTVARHGAGPMRAAFLRDAARFEQALAREADRAALTWSFQHRAGRLAAVLADTLGPDDMLVLPAGPVRARLREVVLLQTGAAAGLEPLARALAERLLSPLRALADDPETLKELGPGSVVIGATAGKDLPGLLARTRCIHILHSTGATTPRL
ncbi:hypothetical protein EV663_11051 [Rhodovulum bhavnagarense]|uniref:Universal stress protein family protein n=1 Tax=Rhodovulum bhavnagarense TaxID=992286 RepID=A0A4R2RAP9_9RHOB|nr:hypothetical protein [Rhodovulum bhavnagarense]TCP60370.1 hypothetical protein EV663_11051 [Rhodovulum bhavnagarense]